MTLEWERRQKHHEDLQRILCETGCLDSKGHLRSWRGPVVVPLIESAGHTVGANFEECRCRNAPEVKE